MGAQIYNNYAGARSSGIAHSSVAVTDIWATHHNQAGLAFLEKSEIGISYQNLYFLDELVIGHLALAFPHASGTIGLNIQYFGFDLYNESKIGLTYSRAFGKRWSVGTSINYQRFFVEQGSTNKGVPTIELGFLYKPLKTVQIGVHFYNFTNSSKNNETNEKLPVVGRLGIQKNFNAKTALTAEVSKQESLPEKYGFGFEYYLMEKLGLRCGVGLNPISSAFGLTIGFADFQVHSAYEYSYFIGGNASFSLQYQL